MPRYYFDLIDDGMEPDIEGVELSGPGAARSEAYALLTELAAEQTIQDGEVHLGVVVRDEAGTEVVMGRFELILAGPVAAKTDLGKTGRDGQR